MSLGAATASTYEALVGPRIILEHEILDGHTVLVRDGRIHGVTTTGQIPAEAKTRELGPGFLGPGLVDVHTHGGGGSSFNDGTADAVRAGLAALRRGGVTTVLPTLVTAPVAELERAVALIDGVRGEQGLPRVAGTHLEGPYFSSTQCGAQDPEHLRTPNDGSVDRLLDLAPSIRMMSFAPELPGAVDLTRRLVRAGIVAAAGHSAATPADLLACQREGLRHVIHVFSGQSTTVRRGPWRQPGLLEASLASDGLTVEMIADGKHLPSTLMRLAHRCLAGRLCLVSDSTPGAGMAEGERYRMGRMEYVVEDGVGMTLDRTQFGGSTTMLGQMVGIAVRELGIGVPEAVAMASTIPARAAGLDPAYGRIATAAHADLVLFSEELSVRAVAIAGHWEAAEGEGTP